MLLDRRRADATPFRKIVLDLTQALVELAGSAFGVAPLMVIEAHGEVNQGLQKPAFGLPGGSPNLFENLVAVVELATVE
jgi:hypothetical protein